MPKKLYILWTSNDVNTAHLMVFMYAINSLTKDWWDEVTIIIWGASAKLVAEDKSIQDKIEMAKSRGVHVSACINCAAQFGVVEKLRELDLEVVSWGQGLTELLQNHESILTV